MVVLNRNNLINDNDLSESTSLIHLLDRDNTEDDDETHILKHSPFYCEDTFKDILVANAGLCVLDLNIQSIYAKFDEFQLFIERVSESHPISVICLNECWINEGSDLTTIQLPNFKMFHQI